VGCAILSYWFYCKSCMNLNSNSILNSAHMSPWMHVLGWAHMSAWLTVLVVLIGKKNRIIVDLNPRPQRYGLLDLPLECPLVGDIILSYWIYIFIRVVASTPPKIYSKFYLNLNWSSSLNSNFSKFNLKSNLERGPQFLAY
jgi:hypothetical protein